MINWKGLFPGSQSSIIITTSYLLLAAHTSLNMIDMFLATWRLYYRSVDLEARRKYSIWLFYLFICSRFLFRLWEWTLCYLVYPLGQCSWASSETRTRAPVCRSEFTLELTFNRANKKMSSDQTVRDDFEIGFHQNCSLRLLLLPTSMLHFSLLKHDWLTAHIPSKSPQPSTWRPER